MSEMRDGLTYETYCTSLRPPIYRIGAILRQSEPWHGGNVHMLDELYETKAEAEAALAGMLAGREAEA